MVRKLLLKSASLIAIFTVAASANGYADTPMEPMNETAFCSKSELYCAHSTAKPAHLDVFEKKNLSRVLWSRNEFVTRGFLSDDGKAVVSCYVGLNLLPLNAKAA